MPARQSPPRWSPQCKPKAGLKAFESAVETTVFSPCVLARSEQRLQLASGVAVLEQSMEGCRLQGAKLLWSLGLEAADALLPVSNQKTQLMPSPGSPPLGTHDFCNSTN